MFEIDKSEKKLLLEVFASVWFYIGFAIIWFWSYSHFGYNTPFVGAVVFGTLLLILSLVDLKHFILPDSIMIPAGVFGLLLAPSFMGQSWINTFAGMILGFGLLFTISWIFFKLRGYHGLGFGDVKFLGVLGAWVGATSLPPLILIASFLAIPVFILRRLFKGTKTSNPLPFGPFLAIAGWLMLLYDLKIWGALLHARATVIQTVTGG